MYLVWPAAPTGPTAAPDPAAARGVRRGGRWLPLLPVLAVMASLCVPAGSSGVADDGRVTLADLASGVLVGYVMLRMSRERARPLEGKAAVLLALPTVGLGLATIASFDPAASLPGFVRALQIFVLVPAAVVLLLRDRRDFAVLAGGVVLLAVFQGAVGAYQYATATGASYQGEDIRAVGTFGAVDVMGMSTLVSYGVVLALAYGLFPPPGSPRALRTVALTVAGTLGVPLLVSFSRGAWIATTVTALVLLLLAGRRLALRTLAVTGALAVVLVGGLGVGTELVGERLDSITRVTDAPDQSVTDRYSMWAAATAMWRQDPLTGVGPKGFPAHRDGHASLALSSGGDTAGAGSGFHREPLLSPHNMYLLVLSEQGLLGLTTLVGSWAAFLLLALRRLRTERLASGSTPACGLAAVGLLVWQLVDFLYADIGGPSTVLTALVLGLVAWWALHRDPPLPDREAVR